MNTILDVAGLPATRVDEPLEPVRIDTRYNGPRHHANGGYAAGRLAAAIEGPARVVLRRPIPLGRTITLRRDGRDGLVAVRGRTVLAEVTRQRTPIAAPHLLPSLRQAERASALHGLEHVRHPLSYCYVCSPHRIDGLGVTPGPLPGVPGMLAALFRVPRMDGAVPDVLAWAALDCPSYPADAFAERRLALLGTIAVDQARALRSGELIAVVGWTISRGTRSTVTGSALVDAAGELVAIAESIWVDLPKRWWRR